MGLIQYNWCSYKMGKYGPEIQREDHMKRYREKIALYQPGREVSTRLSEGTNSAHTLIPVSHLPYISVV